MPHIKVTSLACDRGGRRIFAGLSFAAGPSDYVELRGTNGSGKSSLLRVLAGLIDPADGELSIEGDITYAGHLDGIKPALTVVENLAFWTDCFGTGNVTASLKAFSLEALANNQAAALSQGQKRRLCLTRLALVPRPIWLLDEPTVGLDVKSLTQLHQLIAAHLKTGGTVIAATHQDIAIKPTHTLQMDEFA